MAKKNEPTGQPVCPNSKCKKSDIRTKEVDSGTGAVRIFVVYCNDCGRIINSVAS